MKIAIEIKLCNRREREKQLIAEINDDIVAYRKAFTHVVFVVYDVGMIRDIALLTEDFKREGVLVFVVKH